MTKQLILASSSPRRQALLKQVNIPFSIRKPNVDESQIMTNDPVEKVKQLSLLKGNATSLLEDNEVILSADTVVSYDHQILEKPKDKQDAFKMLSLLSGSVHEVFTGVTIRSAEKEITFAQETEVKFWPLSESEINNYIASGEPFDKAGAYGIQGMGAILVKKINGDYFNVMGLPISRVCRELREFSILPY
ncbi:MAG TPA: Maf family protein [Candidatus Avamphibacillus sp.]|nr:Maf family protein [Candidatus Avamphibacillus sp.]